MINGIILGTGTSTGIPIIACRCSVCTSDDPRDVRLRCSCYLEVDGVRLLIDAGPDLRRQALRHGIPDVDAVLITHHHFDHVAGLDDLRPYLFDHRPEIPCWAHPDTVPVLESMFAYIFKDGSYPGVPRLQLHAVQGDIHVSSRSDPSRSVTIRPIPARHGSLEILGYRIGGIAYLTDVSDLPESSYPLLQDLEWLFLDALRDQEHPMHMTFEKAFSVAERIGATHTRFIHMSHHTSHTELLARCPVGMEPAFDGLTFRA